MSRSRIFAFGLGLAALLLLLLLGYCRYPAPTSLVNPAYDAKSALAPSSGRLLGLDDAVVSGFSGTIIATEEMAPVPIGEAAINQTFIDTNGPAARVFSAREPRFVWNGTYWAAPQTRAVTAAQVGQVFGIAIDDRAAPDVYLAATAVYGLNLIKRRDKDDDDGDEEKVDDDDDLPHRLRAGEADAHWMAGQFGPGGGPNSIWRIDGRSGQVSLFANVTLDGAAGGPAALGNLAYDSEHHQLFVSDLSTGMVHRLDLKGHDLGHYDHGIAGRRATGLPAVGAASTRVSITDTSFKPDNPATWGFASSERRVWGLAVHDHRLYYAVADGHIWSVGLTDDGNFASDPRKEVDVPGGAAAPPVSDIVFSHEGAMIVAQRAIIGTHFDYRALAPSGVAHVYRFWREGPDDPNTPTSWYQQPEEYAVGFAGGNRNTGGGVDLGYGYKSDGTFDFSACEEAILFTGDALRDFRQTESGFEAGGPLHLNGLQISPAKAVRGFNAPPIISYFVSFAGKMESTPRSGALGGVRVYRLDCAEIACRPQRDDDLAVDSFPPSAEIAGVTLPPKPPHPPNPGDCDGTDCSADDCTGAGCTPCVGPDCKPCTGPDCTPCIGDGCTPCKGADCTNGKVCMKVEGHAVCDPASGGWVFKVTTLDSLGFGIDTLSAYSRVPGVSVTNGPQISLVPPPGIIKLSGTSPGQTVTIDVCGFNSADPNYLAGKPYDCCREKLRVRVPKRICKASDEPPL